LNTKSNVAPSNKRKLKHDGDPGSETKKTSRKRIARPIKATPNRKKAVSQAKSTDNLTLDKPEAFGEPPIWADKRQALCETLPYYRAYQSGAYTSHSLVYGFLYDKEVGARDVFTDQVYIARVYVALPRKFWTFINIKSVAVASLKILTGTASSKRTRILALQRVLSYEIRTRKVQLLSSQVSTSLFLVCLFNANLPYRLSEHH
jgi:hypothetical protein